MVNTEEEMMQLWAEMHTHTSHPPSMPSLDFNSEMAVFVFSGARGFTGYHLNLEEVWEKDGKIVLGIEFTCLYKTIHFSFF